MRKATIAYITETAVSDRHAWSGTAHFVFEALREHGYEVIALGPARPRLLRMLLGGLNKASLLISGKRLDYRHSAIYSRAFGRIFSRKLDHMRYDAVVVCGGTEYGAYLRTAKPVFYVLDRTIAGALGYHSILSGLWHFSRRQSVATDRRAMQNAAHLFFSSKWAAEHAMRLYGIPDERISVLPFGANMDRLPTRTEALREKPMDVCRLLLVGTSWKNKGAGIAVNAMRLLNQCGIKCTLTVAGCTPPESVDDRDITILPFIDKNTPAGQDELFSLFLTHNFFILPTRFDCTPIVFCEAASFGLPVLCADTGGVRGHIEEGLNGFTIDYNDDGPLYAERIQTLFADPAAYHALCESARTQFENRLNWKSWAEKFSAVAERHLQKAP